MFFDQPARANTPVERPSSSLDVLPPLPSSTDRKIHTCGLVHFHCVTVPLSTTTFSGSNAELLWCARADVAVSSTAMTKEQVLICNPPQWRHNISPSGAAAYRTHITRTNDTCGVGTRSTIQ